MAPTDKEFQETSIESGKKYGYPKCCIMQFALQTPSSYKGKRPTKDDRDRFKAGHLNGKFTGFVPCTAHARQILKGEITLASLIHKTPERYYPFPFDWSYK